MENRLPQIEDFLSAFSAMPAGKLLFFALFVVTWVIGGNVVVAFHYKRRGKHWASGFKPFAFPFKDFNAKEWLMMLGLAVLALTFGAIGLSWGN